MLLLSRNEIREWRALADEALAGRLAPDKPLPGIRPNLMPMFYYYIGDDYTGLFTMHYGR